MPARNLIPELSGEEWLIEETDWAPEKQNLQETVLAIGNGYLGSRGVLEEIPEGSQAGTYFAGLFDSSNTQVTELVNTPNTMYLRITADGERLDISKMKTPSHHRALDLRNGTLHRKTVFMDSQGRRYELETFRFFSLANRHTGILRAIVTPLDSDAELEIEALVDDAVTNRELVTGGDETHFLRLEKSSTNGITYLADVTLEARYLIGYANQLKVHQGGKEISPANDRFEIKVRKGEPVCLTKHFSFHCTREEGVTDETLKEKTINELRQMLKKGFEGAFKEHEEKWEEAWGVSDIKLKKGVAEQKALRYNIFNLMICANPEEERAGVGAKALTGQGYKGHVFWDLELFMLPFFIYTNPRAARSFLLYRYHNLEAARRIAAGKGFKGALYPWESADRGEEVTPNYTFDLDRKLVRTAIGEGEHIDCDIAYGVFNYYETTRDKDFLLEYGLEILFETSRYWASRLRFEEDSKAYGIHGVRGPDEFHGHVDNNAFTNGLVKFLMQLSAGYFEEFSESSPERLKALAHKIDLKAEEVRKWRELAGKIKMPPERGDRIIEQFDGYFKLKNLPLPPRSEYYRPVLRETVSIQDLAKIQYIKQADTLILLYLFSDNYDRETKRANYEYYEARTLHKSSLSPSTYAIMASEVGDLSIAFKYFQLCLFLDLKNLYSCTDHGVHAASLGSTWQVVVNGFCGMRIGKDKLSFSPAVPPEIEGIDCTIVWRGSNLRIQASNDRLSLLYAADSGESAEIYVYGRPRKLEGGVPYAFEKPGQEGDMP